MSIQKKLRRRKKRSRSSLKYFPPVVETAPTEFRGLSPQDLFSLLAQRMASGDIKNALLLLETIHGMPLDDVEISDMSPFLDIVKANADEVISSPELRVSVLRVLIRISIQFSEEFLGEYLPITKAIVRSFLGNVDGISFYNVLLIIFIGNLYHDFREKVATLFLEEGADLARIVETLSAKKLDIIKARGVRDKDIDQTLSIISWLQYLFILFDPSSFSTEVKRRMLLDLCSEIVELMEVPARTFTRLRTLFSIMKAMLRGHNTLKRYLVENASTELRRIISRWNQMDTEDQRGLLLLLGMVSSGPKVCNVFLISIPQFFNLVEYVVRSGKSPLFENCAWVLSNICSENELEVMFDEPIIMEALLFFLDNSSDLAVIDYAAWGLGNVLGNWNISRLEKYLMQNQQNLTRHFIRIINLNPSDYSDTSGKNAKIIAGVLENFVKNLHTFFTSSYNAPEVIDTAVLEALEEKKNQLELEGRISKTLSDRIERIMVVAGIDP